ncbi:unnamed protein product [Cuscuta epithymum]|uniref:Uncharacterized protein n=1 Tax=Cuscuta epithymum TaxID=186058 RepID=A0AAV0C3W9_9ASTE|nr:unnamed protein product [Cuscuta epithymum]
MSPSVELLAEHDAARADSYKDAENRVADQKVDWQNNEGHSPGQGVQIIGELPPRDRPRPLMVPLERFYLVSENRSVGGAVVVDGPVVDSGAEVRQNVADVSGEKRLEP